MRNKDQQLHREKNKARNLRKTNWWKKKQGKGICHYCQKSFPPLQLTMDHQLPLSRGGKSIKSNLVACCKNCNNQKRNYLFLAPLQEDSNK